MKMKKTYSVYSLFLMLAGLVLFMAQGVEAKTTKTPFTSDSATNALAALQADATAVMFDTRTVDEHNGCGQPWNAGNACPGAATHDRTPMWDVTVNGETVSKLPITVPYWDKAEVRGTGVPEGETETPPRYETREIIEKLLAAGVIDFDTPIYLICRTAYRSFYMSDWMDDQTFYSAITGTTEYFEKLINIDTDGTPGGGLGGMQEWIDNGLPLYSDSLTASDNFVPPQVFSVTPKDGDTLSTGDVSFTVSVLEATTATGGVFTGTYGGYSTVTDVSLYIDQNATAVASDSTDTTGAVWTDYTFPQTLTSATYTWNSSVTNSPGTSWNQNVIEQAADSGLKGPGERSLIVNIQGDITVTPTSLDFGNVAVGVTSPPTQEITVTNDGGTGTIITLGTLSSPSGPFTIGSTATDECVSNQTLAAAESCKVTVEFNPTSTDELTVTFTIPSDDPDESVVNVSLKGAGVNLPTTTPASDAPELVSPGNNATGVSPTLTFTWKSYEDASGIPAVEYKLFYCKQNDFSGSGDGCAGKTVDAVASLENNKGVYYYAGTGFGLLLFGIVLTGGVRERKKILLLLAAMIITSSMLFVSCGGSDSTVNAGDAERSDYKTFAVDLGSVSSGTSYYWGVTAVNAAGEQTPSALWSFKVE